MTVLADLMQSASRTVRERAAGSIALMSECDKENQRLFVERSRNRTQRVEKSKEDELINGIAPSIVGLLKVGALDAIRTVENLTVENVDACNILRDYGAVNLLAGFINSESTEPPPGMPVAMDADGNPIVERVLSEAAQKWGLGLDNVDEAARPTIVPVESKSHAVAALRNVALSSDENLNYITRQKIVIPQLVQLMTKMNDTPDDASSLHSGSRGSRDSDPTDKSSERRRAREERRSKTNTALKERMEIDLQERKKLAKENRKLAESAGKMLHTLIIEGNTTVKKTIIHAIIEQVQQPGSVPPKDVPALMTILQSTAKEQLALVQDGQDESSLQAALGFGRWVKLPTLMLGEARNAFKEARESLKDEEKRIARHQKMGLKTCLLYTSPSPRDS